MMSRFHRQFLAGRAFEERVLLRVSRLPGWRAEPFQERLLPADIRERLTTYRDPAGRPVAMRWAPDVLVERLVPPWLVFVEVKSTSVERLAMPDYAIEIDSLDGAERVATGCGLSLLFACDGIPDWRVFTPDEVRTLGARGPDTGRTPYLFVPKTGGRAFGAIFGPESPLDEWLVCLHGSAQAGRPELVAAWQRLTSPDVWGSFTAPEQTMLRETKDLLKARLMGAA